MSPAEDAQLLLAIVRRHLRSLRFGLDPAYPQEDWGFTAHQAQKKLLKAWIVQADRQPPRVHDLQDLAALAGQPLEPTLAALQVFAVEARYEEEPFPLPVERGERSRMAPKAPRFTGPSWLAGILILQRPLGHQAEEDPQSGDVAHLSAAAESPAAGPAPPRTDHR